MESTYTTKHKTLFLLLLSALLLAVSTQNLRTAGAIGPPLGSAIVQTSSCVPPPSGMISWWPGDGNAADIIGTNSGSLQNGATFAAGMVGQAFNLDGVDDAVQIPSNPNLNIQGSFSADAWIFPRSLPNSGPRILDKDSNLGHRWLMAIDQATDELGVIISGGSSAIEISAFTPANSIPLNQWSHVAFTYSTSGTTGVLKLFINGSEAASVTGSAVTMSDLAPLVIGNDSFPNTPGDGNGRDFDGLIDEVEIFNRALSASEIQAIVNAGSAGKCRTCSPPPSGMVSWWAADGDYSDIQGINNGTPTGGTQGFAIGEVGQAFDFISGSALVQVAPSPSHNLLSAVTIEAWIKPVDPNRVQLIAGRAGGPGNFGGYQVALLGDGRVRFTIHTGPANGGAFHSVDSTSPIPANVFTHVAGTYDQTTGLSIYVNGVSVPQMPIDPITGPMSDDPNSNFEIGEFSTFPGVNFVGQIDEVSLYNRALSASEILAIVNAGSAGKCKPGACSITCPANTTVSNDQGQCGAVVNYSAPVTSSNCGTVTCSPASSSFFAVGTTTVSCSTTAGPSCSFTVTVNDTQAPTITCPSNITKSTDPNQCQAVLTYPAPTVADNCPCNGGKSVKGAGGPTCTPTCTPASGSTFPKGTTTVNCIVSDVAGNTSGCSFTVTVNDTQAPTISCPGNITITAIPCEPVNYNQPTVSDNCPGVGTPSCNPASGFCFGAGTTTVTCSVTDSSGNQASCSFTVTVSQTPCTMTCPANKTVTTAPGQCSAVVTYSAPTTTGSCGTVFCVPASGTNFFKGVTTVTCFGSEGPGCSFTVTVNDAEPPSITCPASITSVTPNIGGSTAVVTYPNPTASDNCPGVTTACNPPSGSTFPIGCTTVTCTATDTSSNTATCTFQVCVFNICLQDDSNANNRIVINSATGDYRFCCNGMTFTGRGKMTIQGSTFTLEHNTIDRRVRASVTGSARTGNASLQAPPGRLRCNITDGNTANNTNCASCQ